MNILKRNAIIGISLSLSLGACVQQTPPREEASLTTAEAAESFEHRIVATSASTCEIMAKLGIDLIGIPNAYIEKMKDEFPNAISIGTAMAPDMEILKDLNPTDVIGPDTLEADLKPNYDNIGVSSTFIDMRSVEGMYKSIELLGEKYNKADESKELIDEYVKFMDEYKEKNSDKESPRVLVLMGLPGSYLVATNNSYSGSLVELAGAENVFRHEEKDFLIINTEEMLSQDPDIILRTAHALPKETMQMFADEFESNDIWKHFRAVKEGRVFDANYEYFGMSATFDYPQALNDLETILYGD